MKTDLHDEDYNASVNGKYYVKDLEENTNNNNRVNDNKSIMMMVMMRMTMKMRSYPS